MEKWNGILEYWKKEEEATNSLMKDEYTNVPKIFRQSRMKKA